MTLQEAKEFLRTAIRYELRDHAFGDKEVTWEKDGRAVAFGYFSGSAADISFDAGVSQSFGGKEARQLETCGTLGTVERNDETGPNEYEEGKTMPGLTLEGVWKELTGE